MKQTRHTMRIKSLAGAMALLALAGTLHSALAREAMVVTTDGRTMRGSAIRMRANGDVVLQTDQGPITFPRGRYERAVAPQPDEYEQAVRAIRGNQLDRATELLQGIIRSLRGLEWDDRARILLAEIQARQDDFNAARSTYEELFRSNPRAKEDSNVAWGYRKTLLKTDRIPALENELDEVIKSGSRQDAARAQIMRGDIRNQQGQLEPAILDYMRTMVFFKDVPEQLPEAMFKAAQGLERMRDDRARQIYQDIVNDFPGSPYAQEARAKL